MSGSSRSAIGVNVGHVSQGCPEIRAINGMSASSTPQRLLPAPAGLGILECGRSSDGTMGR